MFWSAFAGSGVHTWLIVAGIIFLAWMTVRAIRMAETIPDAHPETLGSLDLRERGLDPVDGNVGVSR